MRDPESVEELHRDIGAGKWTGRKWGSAEQPAKGSIWAIAVRSKRKPTHAQYQRVVLVVAYGFSVEMLAGLVTARLATVVTETRSKLVLAWAQRFMRSPMVFLGFRRISAVEGPLGTAIQIFDDDVVAFTSLSDLLLLLLISTTFPYLCDCWLGDAEAYHADGDCHTNECDSDTAQSVLPDVHGLSVQSHRSALAPLPGGRATGGSRPVPLPDVGPNDFALALGLKSRGLRAPIGFTKSSMMDIRRDGPAVRLYTRNAYDWTLRLPAIAATAQQIKAKSFTLDGEAVVVGPDGLSRIEELRRREAAHMAILVTGLRTGHRPMTGTLAVKCCTRAVYACALFREDR